ncbi:MAG: RecQ family ATP-dependent DNA helicase [Hyphomonadaceae bacterium]
MESSATPTSVQTLAARCVSLDLEVNPTTAKLFAFAAVRKDRDHALQYRNGDLTAALDQLEKFVDGADFIVGHNLIRFDLPQLVAARPSLARLSASTIDTLWLNPLAFPKNPYHHLVKHYQDGRLQAGHVNDPELDARLVLEVLGNQLIAFAELGRRNPEALAAYHYLTTNAQGSDGFDAFFSSVRGAERPNIGGAETAFRSMLSGRVCSHSLDQTLDRLSSPELGWPLAYALSWISVAGGDSVMPPWVRRQFREASLIVRHLRDTRCDHPHCAWCHEKNDPKRALKTWFGFDEFRPEPADEHGRPLQERIVGQAMAGKSVLGILPTGTGKSICYQLPALARFEKTGALAVVISPLVALMADQVQGLTRQGISSCVTINGLLSMPERQAALEQVRMGEASMLLISPEQLRSVSVRSVISQREIGYWVLDEAHCISKWGHDFRPDYRYVSRFIREFSGDEPPAPIICLTATAKPDVVRDIQNHFKERVGVDLLLLDGGAVRTNLSFEVLPTERNRKLADILDTIERSLPADGVSGAIVYCSSRKATERVAEFLRQQGLSAERFHAGLKPDEKKEVQERFRTGSLRIIAATNAFGMGIDKPDIRLVVHGDIPGSLENYLQEAGRAGRDREHATCVLLYSGDDVERQFELSARSRLARHEIAAILKALRRLDGRMKKRGEVVATTGEIVREELDQEFERDKVTNDTRVKTAVAWLEESKLLAREENRVNVFPSSLLVRTVEQAKMIVDKAQVSEARRRQLIAIVRHLMAAPVDAGVTTDELCGAAGLSPAAIRHALSDLEALGIASDDTAISIFISVGVANASSVLFDAAERLESALLDALQELAPDAEDEGPLPLNLAATCQGLKNRGLEGVRPDLLEKLLRSLASDGRGEEGGSGNLQLRKLDRNNYRMAVQRPWGQVSRTAELRRKGAKLILAHLEGRVAKGTRGKDIQVETTLGKLNAAIAGDMFLRSEVPDVTKLVERALVWLAEQSVVILGKGLTIFRPAITVHLAPGSKTFTTEDFQPLEEHYKEQTIQTHIMATYAERGLASIDEAQRLTQDYFELEQDGFLRRWMPARVAEYRRQTRPASFEAIVKSLGNTVQESIVADDREQTNVLVLAGPGSGKTRVLVHRIAYLIRVRRENPSEILVLTYNRHAAAEVRERLRALIGEDAARVTVSTCHALAMRLVGTSFSKAFEERKDIDFDRVVMNAVALLTGEGLSKPEAEAQRDLLIQGYRWILVDEYQDIGQEEYALIAAVAGRTIEDPDMRLTLFAVGDDDQNIYAFKGASVEYIRRFGQDYSAKPVYLTENYRSTHAIIDASNKAIALAANRMKAGQDIIVNSGRRKDAAGGVLDKLDPVAQGRVQLLRVKGGADHQAVAAVEELRRLSQLVPAFSWTRAAIIAREWSLLEPVRSYCEGQGIPVDMANEGMPSPWRLRETRMLLEHLRASPARLFTADDLLAFAAIQKSGRWWEYLAEGIATMGRDLNGQAAPGSEIVDWLGEWFRGARQHQRGLLLLTAHRAKGLEFDDVVILDGGWDRRSIGEDRDAQRRLFYVAMTRARRSLAVTAQGQAHPILSGALGENLIARTVVTDGPSLAHCGLNYVVPNLKLVDLSFAGRLRGADPAHAAIAAVKVGDPVQLALEGDRWAILNTDGIALGRMAKAFVPPRDTQFVRGAVGAVINWRRSDSAAEFQDQMRSDEWEVVLPDLVFCV